MRKFVLVSGVDLNTNLDSIDEEIIRLTGKEKPKVLFIPTASGDDPKYCALYKKIYEGKFGCTLDVLYLVDKSPSEDEIREKVFSSDILYIGGGPTERLMKYFNRFNMKNILSEATEKGIVLSAISEGAVCLGSNYFYTDEPEAFEGEGFRDFVKIECLGFLNLLICPHFNLEGYSDRIAEMIKQCNLLGIGLDNNCALEIVDDKYRIISSKCGVKTYALYLKDEKLFRKAIEKKAEFSEIKELMRYK